MDALPTSFSSSKDLYKHRQQQQQPLPFDSLSGSDGSTTSMSSNDHMTTHSADLQNLPLGARLAQQRIDQQQQQQQQQQHYYSGRGRGGQDGGVRHHYNRGGHHSSMQHTNDAHHSNRNSNYKNPYPNTAYNSGYNKKQRTRGGHGHGYVQQQSVADDGNRGKKVWFKASMLENPWQSFTNNQHTNSDRNRNNNPRPRPRPRHDDTATANDLEVEKNNSADNNMNITSQHVDVNVKDDEIDDTILNAGDVDTSADNRFLQSYSSSSTSTLSNTAVDQRSGKQIENEEEIGIE
jgi:hypothetical protein